jgi:hypothetical protein
MQAKVKAKGAAQKLVVTANRLRDGRVVWLAQNGEWVETVREAAVFPGEQVESGLAVAEEAERRHVVVAPYPVEVDTTPRGPVPLRMRERLRVAGPSVLPQAAE